jgi:hypothetical protein
VLTEKASNEDDKYCRYTKAKATIKLILYFTGCFHIGRVAFSVHRFNAELPTGQVQTMCKALDSGLLIAHNLSGSRVLK